MAQVIKEKYNKKLQAVYAECVDELNAIEIPFRRIVDVTVNYRAKGRWGQCTKKYDAYGICFTININADLCHPDAPVKALKETIIHEILHTCPDCFCHTGEWKRLADLVSDCYGYRIQRTSSATGNGMADFYSQHTELTKTKWKYTICCAKCGKVIARRQRTCDLVKYPMIYTHTVCGGHLKVVAS
jgi:hypothetical protein